MPRFWTALFLLLVSHLALAENQWRLELIVFERDQGAAYSPSDAWTFKPVTWPELLPLDAKLAGFAGLDEAPPQFILQAASRQGIAILPFSGASLSTAANKLDRSGRYRLLSQYSLVFAQNTTTPYLQMHDGKALRLVARDTRQDSGSMMDYWLSAPDLDPPVDTEGLYGWARLDHQIHPILQLDLSYQRVLPGVFPNTVDPDGRLEYFRDQVLQYRIRAERRLRPGLTAYFDHPQIGVLARLSLVEPAADPSVDP